MQSIKIKLILLGCCTFLFVSCMATSVIDTESEIAKSEILRRIDNLCNDLPKPRDFVFVSKSLSGNGFTVSVSYDYRTSMSLENVEKFYTDNLLALEWRIGNSGRFEKDHFQVSISPVQYPGAKYSLYCAEVHQ